jgi:hypothetical protein
MAHNMEQHRGSYKPKITTENGTNIQKTATKISNLEKNTANIHHRQKHNL